MRAVRKDDVRHKIFARLYDYAVRINNCNLFASAITLSLGTMKPPFNADQSTKLNHPEDAR